MYAVISASECLAVGERVSLYILLLETIELPVHQSQITAIKRKEGTLKRTESRRHLEYTMNQTESLTPSEHPPSPRNTYIVYIVVKYFSIESVHRRERG